MELVRPNIGPAALGSGNAIEVIRDIRRIHARVDCRGIGPEVVIA